MKHRLSLSSSSDYGYEESELSAGDQSLDYGSAAELSNASDDWDCRSQDLYDGQHTSEDFALNAYHLQSEPRLLQL